MPKSNRPPVCDADLENLRASGLTDATIRAAGIYTERDPAALARLLNYERVPSFCNGGGMVFPHFDAEGNRNGYAVVKPHQPRERDGKPVKYEAPLNAPPHAYVSPASRARLKGGIREVVIVEGIKKALAVEQLGYAVIGLSGVWNWKVKDEDRLQPDLEAIGWQGLTIFILFDHDPKPKTRSAVATAARRLGRLLLDASAAEIRVTDLPAGPDNAKNGIDDHLATFPPEGRAAVLRKLLDGAKGLEESTVVVGTDEYRVSDEAEAILAANASNLYQRGRQLVQVLQHDPAAGGEDRQRVRRSDGAPIVRTIPSPILRNELSRYVRFARRDKDGDLQPASVPGYAVATIHARGEWRAFRHLEGVVSHPVLLRDGTIMATPGYDAGSGLLLWLPQGLDISIPDTPALNDALAAKEELLDVVSDFPFKADADKSAWLAALLTPLCRRAFNGTVPLFLFNGNVAGVGKGLLVNTISLIDTGRDASVMGYTNYREELRKAITTVALEGDEIVLLDNVTDALGNDVLDRALTATHWKDRILGGNTQYDGSLNATWYATSNNAYIVGDTTRRVMPIRLVSPEEHPEERTGFKYPDLRKHVLDNRGRLLTHALTILRAYCLAGRPAQELNPWRGSFEGWTDLVRAAVVWLGMRDPADTREDIRQGASPEQIALTALYAGIETLDLAGRGLTAAAIIDKAAACMGNPTVKALLDALPLLCPSKDRPGVLPSAISLGKRLHNLKDRVVDDKVLQQLPDTRAGALWRVVRCGDSGAASPRSDCGDSGNSGDVLPERQTSSHWPLLGNGPLSKPPS